MTVLWFFVPSWDVLCYFSPFVSLKLQFPAIPCVSCIFPWFSAWTLCVLQRSLPLSRFNQVSIGFLHWSLAHATYIHFLVFFRFMFLWRPFILPWVLFLFSCFYCCCCGVTAWGMHFNHLKLDGGCGEGFSASSSDAQPPVLVLCSLFLLYLLTDDDNDTTLRKQSTSKFIYIQKRQTNWTGFSNLEIPVSGIEFN